MSFREASIDLEAIQANVAALRAQVEPALFMAVVKADGYGHGAIPVSRAAIAGGADRLGVADICEALALRAAGIRVPILAWLHGPNPDFPRALAAGIEIGVSSGPQLAAVASAARSGDPAVVHLKLDTGLSRNGASPEEWEALFAYARGLEQERKIRVEGVFSHLAGTSEDHLQLAGFRRAIAEAEAAGLRPSIRHIAATAAVLTLPDSRFDMVRCGIGIYGLSPFENREVELNLIPAMTLTTKVAAVRRVAASTGVSYGHTWRAPRNTRLALIPLGYADGIPRHASGRAEVSIRGARCPVVGKIAMDQFVVDVRDQPVEVGDPVTVFGNGRSGEPTADDWARAADTINYEIVTRIGGRVSRTYPR